MKVSNRNLGISELILIDKTIIYVPVLSQNVLQKESWQLVNIVWF